MSQTKEQSIKSSYVVVYELRDGNWDPLGSGGWSEVHLCSDCGDGTFRILAWSVDNQDVLMNVSVTEACVYKESQKRNFHTFKNGNAKWGLGFHKSDEALRLADEFSETVKIVILELRTQANKSEISKELADPGSTQLHLEQKGLINPKKFKPLGMLSILPAKPSKHKAHDTNIDDPDKVKHTRHGYFDKEKQKFVGNFPDSFKLHLNKQFGVKPKQLPSRAVPGYKAKIPSVLIDLKALLKKLGGYEVVGIFRLAPEGKKNDMIKGQIDRGEEWEEKLNDVNDVNLCANLLKVWFRELPTPIMNLVERKVIELSQDVESVAEATKKFPEPSQSILLWLWDMCVEVAEHEATNKMGAQNLAIVIGPNLFNTDSFANPMLAMTFSGKVVTFFQRGIEWRQKLRSQD